MSWREKVANNFREHSGGGDHSYIFRLESPIDQSHKRHTSVVAVVGEKTVWDEQIRKIVLTKPMAKESMDKILLIEVPHETIDWDSPVDYDVNEALQLWSEKPMYRGFWRKPGIRYITILGNRGNISEFQSREDFKRRLVYSKEELELLMSLPTMEHIPKSTE